MTAAINTMIDEFIQVGPTAGTAHPMDSSRILMSLLSLARDGMDAAADLDQLDGIVSPRVLRRFLSALQFRDESTLHHARRVAMMSSGMASRLGWEGRNLSVLEVAALMHDIGKIGVPDHILLKPAKLSPDEADFMAAQHDVGVQLLQACRVDPDVIAIVLETMAAVDDTTGSRYTHQGARILAVADAFDSLSNDQVYRRGLDRSEVLNVLTSKTGRRFDRNIVAALARWLENDGHNVFRPDPEPRSLAVESVVDWETVRQANTLCHIVSYLYLLETLYDGFYIVDSDMKIAVWNRGAERLFGLASNDALGTAWSQRLAKFIDDKGRVLRDKDYPLIAVCETGRPMSATVQLVRESEEPQSYEILSLPLLDADGRMQGVAEIFRNLAGVRRNPGRYRELQWAATRDPLTGVANRGALQARLEELFTERQEQADDSPLSVIFLDIDHFKSINDRFDHSTGDRVLIDLVRLLQDELYSGETIGRYGGEEFVILCPATSLQQGVERAERLRRSVMGMAISNLPQLQITASFGVATLEANDTADSVLQRADKALYEAKHTGRNRTCSRTASGDARTVAPTTEPQADPYVHRASFSAVLASDVAIYKLSGFVDDNRGKVKSCTPERAEIQLGEKGLFQRWGKTASKMPVTLEIVLGKEIESETVRGAASKRRRIQVTVRPIGRPRDVGVFQHRAQLVIELLRSYLVGE